MDEIIRAVSTDGTAKISAISARGIVERARLIHGTSPTATAALGRSLCATSLLGDLLKEEDASLTVRINGGGPIGTIMTVSDSGGNVRGYAQNPQADAPRRADGKLNVGAVVCGADFKFGAGGNMGAEELKNWGKTNGIAVFVMPLMTEWNRKISSRDIREYLETGEVRIAEHFLGRRYFMRGVVEHDRGVGKSFGLPTVNISVDSRKLIPAEGVYDTRVRLADGAVYRGVTNIGARPTFGEDRKAIETHILDFDGDLYGKTLSIEFVDRLRGIFKFDSKEELRAQILQDIERVRSDTDD